MNVNIVLSSLGEGFENVVESLQLNLSNLFALLCQVVVDNWAAICTFGIFVVLGTVIWHVIRKWMQKRESVCSIMPPPTLCVNKELLINLIAL
jgi:hypothetical protein